jgi:SAM-dependent methyltransferase
MQEIAYDFWPSLYHTHHSRYVDDLPFWISLARKQGGPIIELGCGTGRVTIPLSQAGYVVYGLDRDAGMLVFLQNSLTLIPGVKVYIFQADLSEFHLGIKLPFILLPCNTLTTLLKEERLALWLSIANHLTSDGLFAASLPNPTKLTQLPLEGETELEDILQHPVNSEPIQVSSSWVHDHRFFHLRWYYDHLLPDGKVDRLTVETHHDLSPLKVYLDEFRTAKLQLVSVYGDFDYSMYHRDSPNLILLVKKC